MRYRIINKDIMRALLASYYLTKYHRMSFEERETTRMSMEETTKCCETCVNCMCNLEHKVKIGVDETGKPKGTGCIGWENPRLVGQAYTKLMKQNIR